VQPQNSTFPSHLRNRKAIVKNFNFALIPIVVATLSLGACDEAPPSVKVCTDKSTGQRIDDQKCSQQTPNAHGYFPYYWYYMGRGSGIPAVGAPVPLSPGFAVPDGPVAFAPGVSASVARGGFGATAESFGGTGE
jgi:hypothetical protein